MPCTNPPSVIWYCVIQKQNLLTILQTYVWLLTYFIRNLNRTVINISYFHQLGPLGRFGLVVAMLVCLSVYLSDVPFSWNFFWGLSLVLRSQDQIPASHWSTLRPYHMGDFTQGGEWLLKNVPIFFYGKIQTSMNISIDGLQPTCSYELRVSRGPHNAILGHALVELV